MSLIAFAPTPLATLDVALLETLPSTFRCLLIDEQILEPPEGGTQTAPTQQKDEGALVNAALASVTIFALPVEPRHFTIGRRDRCTVVIKDRRVSGSHAAMTPGNGGSYLLSDLGSANGTFVGTRCLSPKDVDGVVIAPGSTFILATVPVAFLDRAGLRAIMGTAFQR